MSVTINTADLLLQAERRKMTCATIYDGWSKVSEDKRAAFDRMYMDSVPGLIAELTQFCNKYHGQFTVVLKPNVTSSNGTIEYRVNTAPVVSAVQHTANVLNGMSLEDHKKAWIKELQADLDRKKLEEELAEKKKELAGIHSQGDRLALVVNKILELNGVNTKPRVVTMQGATTQSTGTPPKNKAALDAAMNKIYNCFGEDIIIKLANKLTPGDSMVQMVINFANS